MPDADGAPGPSDPQSGVTGPSGPQSGVTGPSGPQSGVTGPSDPQSGVTGPSDPQSGVTGPSGPQSGVITPSEGWAVLHLFWRVGPAVDAEAIVAAVKACQGDDHQVVSFVVLGHKADFATMALGPDLWRLHRLQAELIAAGLDLTASYLSLTEVSEYAKGMPPERLEPRLHPRLPPEGKRVVCFYPMSKRRDTTGNWYTLPYEERERLMYGHGSKAREFSGRILQLVTGSTGLDDWEWAVTLFADDPVAIKACVHELRFDEASSIYAEFGPFLVGLVVPIEEALERIGLG